MPAKRRANGEGSAARKRKDGRYEARLSYQDQYGVTKRQTFYGKTSTEVRQKLKAAQARRDSGAPVKDATRTVADWCSHWLKTSLNASDRRATTKSQYETLLRTHVIDAPIGAVPLDKLKPSDIEGWQASLRDDDKL